MKSYHTRIIFKLSLETVHKHVSAKYQPNRNFLYTVMT